ncbi:hypothetical protein ACFY9F_06670 [Streptomyces sp. NPDC012421]|uniref:hypothetical protein n=1 Tax=unclassified Streptomyces TaxID=2593676 RepID=UPI0036915E89
MARPDDSRVVLVHIMSEHDTNPYGTIHGGVMMKLTDDAAAAAFLTFVAIDADGSPARFPPRTW